MFHGFDFIWAYIYDLLIITKGGWADHLSKLELSLQNLKDKGIQSYIKKSFYGKSEMEYLGFWVTWNVIHLINKEVEAMSNLMSLKNKLNVRVLLGLVY